MVLIAHIAARNRFRHEAFKMLVKARMCPEQLNCLGPSRVVEMLVSDQCDDLVAGRIPGHRLGGHVLCAEHSAKEQQTSTHLIYLFKIEATSRVAAVCRLKPTYKA